MTTLADINSRVFFGLEAAGEYLDISAVQNQVVQRLNARTMQARSSTVNVLLGTSDEFTPDVSPYDVTSLIGKSVPAWLEVRYFQQDQVPYWRQVRVVPLSELSDYQALGAFAASFYGDEPADNTSQATQYVAFTYLPGGVCRIRFDRDGERTSLTANILLPDNLTELVVLEAQNSLISRIKFKIAMDMRRDAELQKIAPTLLGALSEIYVQNLADIKPLDAEWRIWAFSDRARETNFNLPTPRGRTLYPDGGLGRWGGGGWNGGNN